MKQNAPDNSGTVETIEDPKEWKKVLESRTNVLAVFTVAQKVIPTRLRTVLQQANVEIRGIGTIVHVPCT